METTTNETENSNITLKASSISVVCRICYDNEKDEPLIAPCRCKGSVAFVHRSCLEMWLAESDTNKCEICHQEIQTERNPIYTASQSVYKWCCYSPRLMGHTVRGDIIACTLITPLAIITTYVCLFGSEYYSRSKFSNVPAASWTSLSLLMMIGIMIMGYYLWVYTIIRLNASLWYNWWQRSCVVRYIPTSTVNLRYVEENETNTPNNTPEIDRVSPNNSSTDLQTNSNDVVIDIGCEDEETVTAEQSTQSV